MPRLLTVATVGAVSMGAGFGVSVAAADPSSDQVTVSVDIVGDSYMAGEGLRDTYIDPADPRHRSTAAPALQALSRVQSDNPRLRVDANLVAAAGAETADFFVAQTGQDNTVVNAPQHDQVRSDSQLVIVGFGGADAQLATVLAAAMRTTSGPNTALDKEIRELGPLLDWTASDEEYLAQATSSPLGQAPTLVARMVQVLAGIMARAPQAKIVVTTYPLAADPRNAYAASLVGEDELTSVRKFGYDLNKAIDRAVQICNCGSLIDLSEAIAGHEVYTADSAFNERSDQQAPQERFQPNDKGASLIANPIADGIASLLQVTPPEPSDGRMTDPKNIDIRDAVSDRDGDTVADSQDRAPDDPARSTNDTQHPDTKHATDDETSSHHGSRSKHSNDTHEPRDGVLQPIVQVVDALADGAPVDPAGDNHDPMTAESRPPAREQTTPMEPTALAPEPATAPPVPGEDAFSGSRDQDVDAQQGMGPFTSAMDTSAADTSDSAPTMGPNVVTVADIEAGPVAAPTEQVPPTPTPSPVRGKGMPSVDVPEFSLPGKFGDRPSRDITIQQLGIADELAQQNDMNPVSVDTTGSPGAKVGLSRFTDRTNQSAMATRNAADGTVDLEVTRRDGLNLDVGVPKVASVGRYANQQMDRTAYKLTPESAKNWEADPKSLIDYGTMLPGDTITRTPPLSEARAREWAAAVNIGPAKTVEAQLDGKYSEGPALQYSVTALGDGRYSVTFGEASFSRSRVGASTSLGDVAKKLSLPFGESIKGSINFDRANSDLKNGVGVVYDTRTPEGAESLRSTIDGLKQGVVPAPEPGSYYDAISENRGEDSSTTSVKLAGTKVPTMPEAAGAATLDRNGDVTRTTTLMRSPDGTFQNGEPIGYSLVTTTRLGTGNPFGLDMSQDTFGGNTVPTKYTVTTLTDGNLRANTVTFTANGQKYTMSEGDMVQRAREMAETDPDTVKGNPVLSELAAGVGVRPAFLSDPPNSLLGKSNKDYNDALQALVTPPDPERNPFAPPPLPERRADNLSVEPEQQALDEPAFDAPAGEAPADATDTDTVDTPATGETPAVPASARSLAQNDPNYDDATTTVDDNPGVTPATTDDTSEPSSNTADSVAPGTDDESGLSDATSADTSDVTTSEAETSVDTDTMPGTPSESETSPGSDSTAESESSSDTSTDASESVSTSDSTSSEAASYGGDASDGGLGGGESASSYGGGDTSDSGSDSASSSYGGGSSYGGSDSSGDSSSAGGDSSSSSGSSGGDSGSSGGDGGSTSSSSSSSGGGE